VNYGTLQEIIKKGRDFFALFLTLTITTYSGDISVEELHKTFEQEDKLNDTKLLKNLIKRIEVFMKERNKGAIEKKDPEFMRKKFQLMMDFVSSNEKNLTKAIDDAAEIEDDECEMFEEDSLWDTLADVYNQQRTTYYKDMQRLEDRFPIEYKLYRRLMYRAKKLQKATARKEASILQLADALQRASAIASTTTEKKGAQVLADKLNKSIEEFKYRVEIKGGGIGGGGDEFNERLLPTKLYDQAIGMLKEPVDKLIEGGESTLNTIIDIMKAEADARKKMNETKDTTQAAAEGGAGENTAPTDLLGKVTSVRKMLRDYLASVKAIRQNFKSYSKLLDIAQVEKIIEAANVTTESKQQNRIKELEGELATAKGKSDRERERKIEIELDNLKSGRVNLDKLTPAQKEMMSTFDQLNEVGDKFVKDLSPQINSLDETVGRIKDEVIALWNLDKSNATVAQKKIGILERYMEGNFNNEPAKLAELVAYDDKDNKDAVEMGLRKMLKGVVGMAETCYTQSKNLLQPNSKVFAKQWETENRPNENNGRRGPEYGFPGGGYDPFAGGVEKQEGHFEYKNIYDTLDWVVNGMSKAITGDLDYLERVIKRSGTNGTGAGQIMGDTSILTTMLNSYLERKDTDGEIVASRDLRDKLISNNLMPSRVLEISSMDKLVFVVFTLFVRMIVLMGVGVLVSKQILNKFAYAVLGASAMFVCIMILFALIVNFDEYKLRIIFNYMNFHVNSGGFFTYLIVYIILSMAVVTLMTITNFPFKNMGNDAQSNEERANIMAKLEMVTAVIWVIMTIMVILT
jgi:hypothetical protein